MPRWPADSRRRGQRATGRVIDVGRPAVPVSVIDRTGGSDESPDDGATSPDVGSDEPRRARPGVVTGLSGAGRSTAAQALEDLGYYVVDNLPPALIADMAELVDEQPAVARSRIAVVLDVRSRAFFTDLRERARGLHEPGVVAAVLFVDADDEVLVRRFESVRRPHPLQGDGRLLDGIAAERELLGDAARRRRRGHRHHPASTCTSSRAEVDELFGGRTQRRLRVTVLSFGFKYGLPLDADLVPTCGSCPTRTGCRSCATDRPGRRRSATTCWTSSGARTFVERYVRLIADRRAGYQREGKRYLTVAVGCTGGKHRSVAIAEELAARLRGSGVDAARRRTATWGASELGRGRSARRARGRRARRRPRAGRVAVRAAHGHRPELTAVVTVADDGGSVGPAARASSACCRPATCGRRWPRSAATTSGARPGRDVLQHRFASPTGDAGRPRGRQPAARRPVGAARRPGRGASTGSAGCSAPSGRVLPMAAVPLDIEADVRGDRPGATRRRSPTCAARSRSRPRPGTVAGGPAGAGRPAGLPGGGRRVADADWVVFGPGVLVHQRAPAPAGARAWRRARRTPGPAAGHPQPRAAAGETDGLAPADHLEVLAGTRPELRLDVVLADAARGRRPDAVESRRGVAGAAELVLGRRSARARRDPPA